MLKRSNFLPAESYRTEVTLIQTRNGYERFMNFDCVMYPAQDEEFGMTADECDQEGDGSSMLLSASNERP